LELEPPRASVRPIPAQQPSNLSIPRGRLPALRHLLSGNFNRRSGYEPGRYRARLAFALALSLLIHALILSLHFGLAGAGLPGFGWPWAERRVQVPPLTVLLAPAPPPATVARAVEPPRRRRVTPPLPPAVAATESVPPAPRAETGFVAQLRAPKRPALEPLVAAPVPVPRRAKAAPKEPRPEIIAQVEPRQKTFSVRPEAVGDPEQQAAPVVEAPPDTAEPPVPDVVAKIQVEEPPPAKEPEQAAQNLAEEDAARRAREQEATRRLEEAKQQEDARVQRLAQELEAKRQADEAARQQEEARKLAEAKKQEEARRLEEAKKQEEARAQRLAQELEAKRQAEEAARLQAEALARQQELETKKQAEDLAARARAQDLAARQKAEGSGAAAPPAKLSGSELAARALQQIRQPEAPRAELPGSRPFPRGADFPRRGSILGSAEAEVSLRMYAESWRLKVERIGSLNVPRSARTRPHYNPLVTVAIRSDGSVEEVFIHRSSGLRELDEAVRRIVHLLAPYSAFPPEMARQFDVVEIQRIWVFTDTLNIQEDVR
jgi:TolA protein